MIIVGTITAYLLYRNKILHVHHRILPGIFIGVTGIAVWIFLYQLHLEKHIFPYLPQWLLPKPREAFNPFQALSSPAGQWAFITVRLIGLAILVPLAEELFWRGFLLRWIISDNWTEVEIGKFTLKSFLWVTFLFTLAHPEWFAAAIYCCLINILIYWKRDLWNCIVAHGISNLLLAIYILSTKTWGLW